MILNKGMSNILIIHMNIGSPFMIKEIKWTILMSFIKCGINTNYKKYLLMIIYARSQIIWKLILKMGKYMLKRK